MIQKVWLLCDARYRTDKDRAICFGFCTSLKEAKENANDYGEDTVIVQAEDYNGEIRNSKIIN